MPSTADIVIVGAGVIGASAAHHLTRMGATGVRVLDRGGVGRGQTMKSGGFIQTHWDNLHEVRLIAKAREIFRSWSEQIGGDCGFVQTGYLHVTGPEKEAEVRRVHGVLQGEGLESRWLTPAELVELQPLLRADDLIGGAFEATSGWADPIATTQTLAEAARRRGAVIEEGVTVLQICHRSGKITGVETSAGFISTGTVVLAVGPWTATLHPDPRFPLPIRVERGQVCYTDRPDGLPEREIAFYDEVLGLYTHTDRDTNLVGIDWDFDTVWGADRYPQEVDADYVRTALRSLAYRFPRMSNARMVRGVVGLYDFTPDGLPIIDGPIGIEGYYVAAGFSGTGFKSAPVTGCALAELVLEGRATSADIDFLRLSRFS